MSALSKVGIATRTLFDFLKHVSQKQTEDPTDWDGWWWVGALRIQQKDGDEEKASQIEGMCQTHADALQTILWLGPGNVESTREMESLQRVLRSHDSNTSNDALKEIHDLVFADPCMIAAVDKAFGNAYWTRVWDSARACGF
ncbi:uncharacterized protein BDR25DRAFT_318844 [Lindgomyces ingoldianus]|uniref:Uncharacterized protein n=1 Tax=Lindgomyces ingoldianus TaxID=673940 RepID=A0ACB6QD09_9PLEO|nr:uncharacterized protein BDR25DRAFT_318844 [Lindgomyces ingoldianus]KAF2464848.1 hypothetical protein BDR25DRAFT_318844 [Lindgomyces ingoldianus]